MHTCTCKSVSGTGPARGAGSDERRTHGCRCVRSSRAAGSPPSHMHTRDTAGACARRISRECVTPPVRQATGSAQVVCATLGVLPHAAATPPRCIKRHSARGSHSACPLASRTTPRCICAAPARPAPRVRTATPRAAPTLHPARAVPRHRAAARGAHSSFSSGCDGGREAGPSRRKQRM